MVRTTKAYFENLPKREAFQQELIDLREEIYTLNQPKMHRFKLVKE